MKVIKTISPPILLFTLVLLINPVASAGVNITDAEAIYEVNLSNVNIPTEPYPVKNIFTLNADAILKQNLSSVSIPANPYPIKNIFIINEDAAFNKNLSTVSIPTNPVPIKKIFLINEDAIAQVSLSGIVFVDIRNLAFNKSVITIPVNTTVTWINFDSVAHTVTADGGSFDSGNLLTNQSFSVTFNVSGTFTYHCSIHPSMTGTVIVTSDNPPPTSISNPQATRGTTWLNWSWNNPPDPDFSHVIVYIDSSFAANVSAPLNYYNATGFSNGTAHTISTRTADTAGNINQTWVNDTATTLSTGEIRGDVNRNGRRDTGDATLILRYIVGLSVPSQYQPVLPIGDMNCNNRIDTGDATLILRDVVGLSIPRCWE